MKIKYLITAMLLVSTSAFSASESQYSTPVNDSIAPGSIDYFIEGKKGEGEKANKATEDGLFYSDHYLAVFDGATDKSGKKYEGRKGGRVARDIITKVFNELEPEQTTEQVLAAINAEYQKFYKANPDLDFESNPLFRPTATLIWYNFDSNELASVGDSKARIDGKEFGTTDKLVDVLNSELRSFTLKQLKLTDAQIKDNDLGREYILPLLKRQSEFQNNPNAPEAFQFWAIDGFHIPADKVNQWSFESMPNRIELSSDGYHYPENATIASYETRLQEVLKADPLMKEKYKSTKGIKKGNVSFDDRSVLIFNKK